MSLIVVIQCKKGGSCTLPQQSIFVLYQNALLFKNVLRISFFSFPFSPYLSSSLFMFLSFFLFFSGGWPQIMMNLREYYK